MRVAQTPDQLITANKALNNFYVNAVTYMEAWLGDSVSIRFIKNTLGNLLFHFCHGLVKIMVEHLKFTIVMRCTIWYHLHNLRNVKNTHGRVLLSEKLQAIIFNFTKSKFLPGCFMFFKLNKWYQIVQRITFELVKTILHYLQGLLLRIALIIVKDAYLLAGVLYNERHIYLFYFFFALFCRRLFLKKPRS